ncbi:hypothetical protein SBA2_260067 [Acidobacteriia bacterium SbA2]|nr:hypothetical protein SBA2_260067 [Acidobacteriia bacterium SbA2]
MKSRQPCRTEGANPAALKALCGTANEVAEKVFCTAEIPFRLTARLEAAPFQDKTES